MKKQKKSLIQELREKAKPENKRFISINLDISSQIYAFLRQKKLTQKDFAKAIGKNESEVSKWLSGSHNLTLKSIAKMEAVLNENIILTPQKACEKYKSIKYVPLTVYANINKPKEDLSKKFEDEVIFEQPTESLAS